jgi:hypothetical protein
VFGKTYKNDLLLLFSSLPAGYNVLCNYYYYSLAGMMYAIICMTKYLSAEFEFIFWKYYCDDGRVALHVHVRM